MRVDLEMKGLQYRHVGKKRKFKWVEDETMS